jgi:hypothetical protein
MKIGDKAEQSESREVRLARDSVGLYRLQSDELTGADEISDEGEFPKFGDFLDVEVTHGGANPSFDDEAWVECPGSLAKIIVELGLDVGDCFRIQSARKNPSGEWEYSVDQAEDPTE